MDFYPPGSLITGRYKVVSYPMKGGMGIVYFCIDQENKGFPVALKTFRPEFLPDRVARDRFLREGTAWVDLGRHPHIVRCYEVKYIEPTAFISLELIAKEQGMKDASLRSWLLPGHALSIEQSLLFSLQIAHGLKHAAKKIPGFVHRDLKPENILVGADKLPGTNINRLRVTDFGLSTILERSNEQVSANREFSKMDGSSYMVGARTQLTHGVVGTPLYMAPEQWTGEALGVYTDVYALGCILYEMISGQHVANGESISDLQAAHSKGNLRNIPPDLPQEVHDLLRHSLTLQVKDRYQSWVEVTSALEDAYTKHCNASAPSEEINASDNDTELKQTGWSYNAIGVGYLDLGKTKTAIQFFEKAIDVGTRTVDKKLLADSKGNLGIVYRDLGNTKMAQELFNYHLITAREIGDKHGEGNALCNLGLVFSDMGDLQQAILYYEQYQQIARNIGDIAGESAAMHNLGVAYKNSGNFQQAIEYLEKSLEIENALGNQRSIGNSLGDLGVAYTLLGDKSRGAEFYKKQINISQQIGDRKGEGNGLCNLGNIYADLDENDEASKCYEQALLIHKEIEDIKGEANDSFNLALVCLRIGQDDKALSFAQIAEKIWLEVGSPEVTQAQGLVNLLEQFKQ